MFKKNEKIVEFYMDSLGEDSETIVCWERSYNDTDDYGIGFVEYYNLDDYKKNKKHIFQLYLKITDGQNTTLHGIPRQWLAKEFKKVLKKLTKRIIKATR